MRDSLRESVVRPAFADGVVTQITKAQMQFAKLVRRPPCFSQVARLRAMQSCRAKKSSSLTSDLTILCSLLRSVEVEADGHNV
mmetsp:Transcript_1506/g.2243  ORF Transcript_1506/g.2243 Transcript_1506/m.2243 type:complete len:83 (+) Transcript_1506:4815-5063(+)